MPAAIGHPARPGAWRREPAGLHLHRLGPLERREVERAGALGDERAVRLVGRRVLADGGVAAGPGDRVGLGERSAGRAVGVQLGQLVGDLLVEVADLRLQLLDVLQDVGLPGLVQLLLSQREVADRLVGEGVGDAHGVLGVLLLGREAQRAGLGVLLDGELGGQRRRRAVVAELLGDEPGHLAGRREHGDLGERDGADQRLATELRLSLGHEQGVRGRVGALGPARASGSVPTKANAAPMSAPMAMIGHRRISARTYSIGSTTPPSVGRAGYWSRSRRSEHDQHGETVAELRPVRVVGAGRDDVLGTGPDDLVDGRRVELAAGGEEDPGRRRRAACASAGPAGAKPALRSTSDMLVAARGRCTAVEHADGDPAALLRRDQRRSSGPAVASVRSTSASSVGRWSTRRRRGRDRRRRRGRVGGRHRRGRAW